MLWSPHMKFNSHPRCWEQHISKANKIKPKLSSHQWCLRECFPVIWVGRPYKAAAYKGEDFLIHNNAYCHAYSKNVDPAPSCLVWSHQQSFYPLSGQMRENERNKGLQYLSGVDGSLHDGEVVSVQNGVHVRDIPSENTENNMRDRRSSQRTSVDVHSSLCKISKAVGSLTLSIYLL